MTFTRVDSLTPQPPRRGAEALLEILASEGVDYIFGNPGTTELPLIDALLREPNIHYVFGLQESSVVAMADGYAQASGKVGFVNLHTSGGLGHGMGCLLSAQVSQTPLVVTAGQQDQRHMVTDPLLFDDLVGIATPATKWAKEVTSARQLPIMVRRAFHDAEAAPQGPVFLSLPMDVMEGMTDIDIGHKSRIYRRATAQGLPELAEDLAAVAPGKLALIAGDEIRTSQAAEDVVKVAELLGTPVFGSSWPLCMPFPTDHPLWQGNLPGTAAQIAQVLSDYDAVLALGGNSLVTILYSEGAAIPSNCKVYQLSDSVTNLGRIYSTYLSMVGDIKASLTALIPLIEQQLTTAQRTGNTARIATFRRHRADQRILLTQQVVEQWSSPVISPLVAAHEVMKAIGPSVPIIDEAVATSRYIKALMNRNAAAQYAFIRGGALGWGMPAAVGTGKFDIIWTLQEIGDEQLTDHALGALANLKPEQSARTVITKGQIVALCLMVLVIIIGMVIAPSKTLMILGILMSLIFLISFGLKFLLAWQGSRHRIDVKVTDEDVAALSDKELPIYTILVPMYKEPEVLPILVNALRNLDYPQSRLDIKLVLEADDTDTIDAAKQMGLESTFEIIRVPPSMPRTKPKACNYALQFARGELLTIYDAEDKPEPDQLKRVIAAFRKSPNNVACIQARLNYYNADENWLTRMFTLEYTLWFDFYLPALEHLRIPIPLGGTSNHFLIDVLREVQAWDPYNVTEDADLGVRLTQLDWRVGVVNSTTFEEANVSVTNWIRQRSRWLKGYMQTYLVHMRNPIKFYRMTGGPGFWGFQFFVGGTVLTPLLVPFTLIPYVVWLCTRTTMFDDLFPPFVMYTNLFTLLIGNGFFIYLTLLASFKRRYYRLAPYALTVPAYWLLQTIAAFKGLWQLISKPFYWEKTTHGISKQTEIEREAALDNQTPRTP